MLPPLALTRTNDMTGRPDDDPQLPGYVWALLACAAMAIAVGIAIWAFPVHARDVGQYKDASPEIRDWFKGVRAQNGVPCCDIADGYRTEYEVRGDEFWVPIDGEMNRVPPEAIVLHSRNPTGDAVIWYVRHPSYQPNGILIRCFVLPEMG
jgi:hypothetical protein